MIVETFDDVWWQSQTKTFRAFRSMNKLSDRQGYAAALRQLGLVVNDSIFIYQMTPTTFLEIIGSLLEPLVYPPAPDMTRTVNPMSQYQNNPAIKGVGAEFPPLPFDTSLVSSKFVSPTGTFQKLLRVAQFGVTPSYYADWSLQGMIPMWVCIR